MLGQRKVKTALISVYSKENILPLVELLNKFNIQIISTGGTKDFIEKHGFQTISVESITGYPSILDGRVKTLHPKVFGGILARRDNANDVKQLMEYDIMAVDMVVVDLYPFEETVKKGSTETEIIEKIDIGGVSLIRAAAKNFNDTLVVSDTSALTEIIDLLEKQNGETTIEQRKYFATQAFHTTAHYDSAIFSYFNDPQPIGFQKTYQSAFPLRYGENPHQKGVFYGNLWSNFEQLHGKQISYNNLLDLDAAIALINDFEQATVAILKHNNACGLASDDNIIEAWLKALAGDPISAFGGIIVVNRPIDHDLALEIDKIFFEIIIAPQFDDKAMEILQHKKNRIILRNNNLQLPEKQFRTVLNGVIEQDRDKKTESISDLQFITNIKPTDKEIDDLLFCNKIVKHTKSNAIVLVKNKQLLGSGTGQTSRVDAVKQAINKAKEFGFSLKDAVLASDAFFPFKDSIEIAHKEGINAFIQPGGSVRDEESIEFCNQNNIAMVFTGYRHFKH